VGFEQHFDCGHARASKAWNSFLRRLPNPQMHNPWRRRLRDNPVGEIRVFADNDQVTSPGKFPNLRVVGFLPTLETETIGSFGEKTQTARAGFRRREIPSCRLHHGEMVAHHARGVIKARLHVSAREPRIFFEHFFDGIAGGEKFQNRLHRDACSRTMGRPLQTSGLIEMRSDMNLR